MLNYSMNIIVRSQTTHKNYKGTNSQIFLQKIKNICVARDPLNKVEMMNL